MKSQMRAKGKQSPDTRSVSKGGTEDFIWKNILKTADLQAIIEDFMVNKYNQELFSNKNLDSIAEQLGWDRETILAYFTKVLAQKRYSVFYNDGNLDMKGKDKEDMTADKAMEKLRLDPSKYLNQLDVEVFEKPPDPSIMEDNQLIDKVISKAMNEIQSLCDKENLKTSIVKGEDNVKRLAEEIGHVDRRFLPKYIHDILLVVGENYKRNTDDDDKSPGRRFQQSPKVNDHHKTKNRVINLKRPSTIFGTDYD